MWDSGLPSKYWPWRQCMPQHFERRLETCAYHQLNHLWSSIFVSGMTLNFTIFFFTFLVTFVMHCRSQILKTPWTKRQQKFYNQTEDCLRQMFKSLCEEGTLVQFTLSAASNSTWKFVQKTLPILFVLFSPDFYHENVLRHFMCRIRKKKIQKIRGIWWVSHLFITYYILFSHRSNLIFPKLSITLFVFILAFEKKNSWNKQIRYDNSWMREGNDD